MIAVLVMLSLSVASVPSITIHRHGTADPISGPVRGHSVEGLVLEVSPSLVTVPWSSIARIDGVVDPAWSDCLAAGLLLWRGDERLNRGDSDLAWAAYKEAASAPCDGPVRLAALEGMVQSHRPEGAGENAARIASLSAASLRRGGARTAGNADPPPAFDEAGLPSPMLAPAWADATSASEFLALCASSPEGLGPDPLRKAFMALAGLECGQQAVMPSSAELRQSSLQQLGPLMEAWHDACGPAMARRSAGRSALLKRRADLEGEWKAWATYARARSLAMDAAAAEIPVRAGLADAASIALVESALEAGLGSSLGRASLRQAASCLRLAGDDASALAIEQDLIVERPITKGTLGS